MLTEPCHVLSGVGASLSKLLAKCGIETIQDVLLHLPYRYQDRTRVSTIKDLRLNDWAVVVGELIHVQCKQGRRPTLECVIKDKTGQLRLRFFHFYASQLDKLKVGMSLLVFGEVRGSGPFIEMVHPEYQVKLPDEPIEVDETLTPIYSVTQGLSQQRLRSLVKRALTQATPSLQAFEWMSSPLLDKLNLYPFEKAIHCLHNPPPDLPPAVIEQGRHPAIKRLVIEELLADRISMTLARNTYQSKAAPVCAYQAEELLPFLSQLPFKLTNAQVRVHQEIAQDLSRDTPMMRLVQGDVGSGKTVVAALSALQVILQGYQVALMAPTELLSEQHALTLTRWFEPLGIQVNYLHGKMPQKVRKATLAALQAGECQLLVGTHAVFQESVQFAKLALVIIDEQHRFGVAQRLALVEKAGVSLGGVHQLLMSATPIPRTLKMTQCYLDVSIIDELPPLRTPIVTAVMSQDKRQTILARLKEVIASGRQAYWVCPLIDVSEKLQCQAAVETAEQLSAELPDVKIGLIHGRLSSTEKDKIMSAFKRAEIDLLVATTVIEVGVDVPNASLMMIENAERMGLAQLHQLRGRVGRGDAASYCILLYQAPLSQDGRARLNILRDTTDGFEIAEHDLKIRGAGELLGTKQTGYKQYKIANLARDHELLPDVAKLTTWLMAHHLETAKLVAKRWKGEVGQFLKG